MLKGIAPLLLSAVLPITCAHSTDLRLVDAEALLRQRFAIETKPFRSVEECLPLGDKSGMRAKKVPCRYYYVVKNVEIEKVKFIHVGDLDRNALPTFREDQQFSIENCVSKSYQYSETRHYHSKEEVNITYTENLTNVKDFKRSFDVNISLFDSKVGAKQESSTNTTITYTVGTTSTNIKSEEYDIEVPLNLEVPPNTIYTISMSDTKREASFPVAISLVLKADKMQEIRALAGNVAETTLAQKLNDPETEEKRTFDTYGILKVKGGDRVMSVKRTEKTCP
ncbi:hypothetical protein [Bradyrhizobium canariense]|uniref:hypothetical protein n=1 Tax=Bradyrhizobium canariense TaxID=255045 RepID=UPI001178C0EB|nr:hypothetical protein [Bradyrhizobium canariense]